jgi:hypothetical protein
MIHSFPTQSSRVMPTIIRDLDEDSSRMARLR